MKMWTVTRMDMMLLLVTVVQVAVVWGRDPELRISPPQKDIATPTGKDYGLMCEGVSDDVEGLFTNMRWTDPNGDIVEEGTPGVKQYDSNQLKLSFIKPTADKTGYYNCSALYSNTVNLQASVHVTFYEDISFDDCLEQQDLVVGRQGDIRCHPTARPPPKVRWEKDRASIRSERFSFSQDGIHISNVTEEDKGLYTVEAFVAVTGNNKYRSIMVNVLTPPRIRPPGETYEVVQGEEYSILCQAEGSPPLQYRWLDPMLRDLGLQEGFRVEEGKLTISRVERNSGGDYKCLVQNGAGEAEATFRLAVLVRPTIIQFDNITKKTGEEAMLVCRAEGEPIPTLSIRRDRDTMDIQNGQDDRIEVKQVTDGDLQMLTLQIRNVKRSDDGLYFCKASNDAGAAERVGHLEVLFPPNMTATPTTNVKAWSAKPANLTCVAEAIPNATLTWKFQNDLIEHGDPRYKIFNGISRSNLLVSTDDKSNNYEVFGTYTCEARNPLGEASISIVLEEATAPYQISQVMFDKVTSTTITFMLLGPTNDGGLPITSYLVKYRREQQTEEPEIRTEWQNGSSYILSNLKPRAQYKFSFAAKNVVGEGPWKTETYVMPEETVPEQPLFTTKDEARSDYPDKFQVRFIIPEDNGEPIQHFEIRYFKVEREGVLWRQVDTDVKRKFSFAEAAQNPTVDLLGLTPNTDYKVELRASNKIGNSVPATLVFRTKTGEVNDGHTSRIDSEVISLPGIVAIVVVALLVTLVILDVTCFFRFHCGLLHLLRYGSCGRSPAADKVQATVEDGRACVKEVSTANNGKIKTEYKAPSPKAVSPDLPPPPDKLSNFEKPKTEMDNLAFENRDVRPADLIIDENFKNKSPNGSKASIGKSSPV